MYSGSYVNQVQLLLRCLPEIAAVDCFAVKGGTAINLFVRNLPRLSVDIDLTYLPLKPRDEALLEISSGLQKVGEALQSRFADCRVQEKISKDMVIKLYISAENAVVTVEPSLIWRGTVYEPVTRDLVLDAQDAFQAFVLARTLSTADLYGGKICAALDRQHPRDLFDMKILFENEGITSEIRRAFVVYLAGHNRPMSELLNPRFCDLTAVYEEQFSGMVSSTVTLEELNAVREKLVEVLRRDLTQEERLFLLSMKSGDPEWSILGYDHLERLPALQWKLQNIRKMSAQKRDAEYHRLISILLK
ncbi:MAG: nucleotidyl transferase AbiEii/AbiGii toxin family protein [Spartobacteria bacterium]|nr:nucleotidyl transferase AbiEii/AbiGii toxin family protein [Spartobacteria bacterium]